ncbi:MAG: prolipoprotein diacylglyceryl transferase, partial [SAR86 cluster bacterium]|nr:prolipoprotein diacylglyceryl transferase [SAR86 cluster bacterium]
KKGIVCSSFLILYGTIRFIIENYRQPDSHIGFLAYDMSMGQILCIPMIFIGLLILNHSRKNA